MDDRAAKIFVVDDHPLVREWLGALIQQQPGLVLCGEAESAAAALKAIAETRPNIAIVDLSLKDGSGLELIKRLKSLHPETSVIVLSMHDERLYAERALRAGARGYIMKHETTKNIIAAIRGVLNGRRYVSTEMNAIFSERFIKGEISDRESPVALLSDRELEVFQALGRGMKTRQIARSLGLSIKTVQAFCARIKDKLQLANAAELLRAAVEWNIRGVDG